MLPDAILLWFLEALNTNFFANVLFCRDFHQTLFCKHYTKQTLSKNERNFIFFYYQTKNYLFLWSIRVHVHVYAMEKYITLNHVWLVGYYPTCYLALLSILLSPPKLTLETNDEFYRIQFLRDWKNSLLSQIISNQIQLIICCHVCYLYPLKTRHVPFL